MTDALGDILARLRKTRGLTQEELAAAAGVGVDTVGRIERHERRSVRPATLDQLASALGVTTETLLGVTSRPFTEHTDLGPIRRAVTDTSVLFNLDPVENTPALNSGQLAHAARNAWRHYVEGRHGTLVHALPSLIIDARRTCHATTGDPLAHAHRHLSTAYRLAAGLAGRLGAADLAWTCAERAVTTARGSDTPEIDHGASARYLAWTLVRQGRIAEAERLATTVAERLEPRMSQPPDATRLGVFGNLLFNAATAATRTGNTDRAADLLALANAAAARARNTTSTEAAIFGPRVAGFQLVDHAIRTGDPRSAFRIARTLNRAENVPAFWEAGHRLQLAEAAVMLRELDHARRLLTEARTLAPDWVRHQPLGRTIMRALVDKATRRLDSDLCQLAQHYGVTT